VPQQSKIKGAGMSEVDSNDVLVSFRGVQKSYDGENLIVKDLNLESSSPCLGLPARARPPA
jgi:hypothetical protein